MTDTKYCINGAVRSDNFGVYSIKTLYPRRFEMETAQVVAGIGLANFDADYVCLTVMK